MTMTKREKFLLALFLTACLTAGGARAAERIENPEGQTRENITGETFENLPGDGQSVENGGAICNEGTIGEISGSRFTGNTSDTEASSFRVGASFGGAIYNSGTIDVISDNIFTENEAGNSGGNRYCAGGAVCSEGSIGEISGGSFSDNSADNGGAIANWNGTIGSITNVTFTGNKAESNYYETYGGAIDNFGGTIGEISGCAFTENYSDDFGGALDNYSGSIGSITNCTFDGNEAAEYGGGGGAILNYNGSIGEISGSLFTGNIAAASDEEITPDGGAVMNWDGTIEIISDCTFTENEGDNGGALYSYHGTVGSITNTIFSGNSASYGGAIANFASSIGSITNCTFDGNGAIDGGAISNFNWYATTAVIDIISNTTFTNNSAQGEDGDAYGGAIYNDGEIAEISNCTFTGNSATSKSGNAMGGAIYSEGTIAEISGCTFTGNSVTSESGAAAGGAIYLENDGETNIGISGDLSGNTATSESTAEDGTGGAFGGAIYVLGEEGSSTAINVGGGVSDNTAEAKVYAEGGAIAAEIAEGGSLEINVTGDVSGNSATTTTETTSANDNDYYVGSLGGAIMVYGEEAKSTAITVGGDMSDNTVQVEKGLAAGGAVFFLSSGNTKIDVSGDLKNNSAISNDATPDKSPEEDALVYVGAQGGAIYVYDLVGDDTEIAVGGDVSGNLAEGVVYSEAGAIGAYVAENGSLKISVAGDVKDNRSITSGTEKFSYDAPEYAYGGAIDVWGHSGTTTVINVGGDVIGNSVSASEYATAGAVGYLADEGGSVEITVAGDVKNNTAENTGTNIDVAAAAEAGYNVGATGGAFTVHGVLDSAVISVGGDLSGNTTEAASGLAAGGAIYYLDSGESGNAASIAVKGDISNNSAKAAGSAEGGAIFSYGNLDLSAKSISNNSAVSEDDDAGGGAIFNVGTLTLTAESITNNSATSTGGDEYGAYGGAIYSAGDLEIVANGSNVLISGNYTEDSNGKDDNAIYVAECLDINAKPTGEIGSLKFTLSNGGSVTLEDNIRGDEGYAVDITGDGVESTTFYMLNQAYDAALSVGNTTLSTTQNTVKDTVVEYTVKSFTLTEDINMAVDVDLANEEMDRFTSGEYDTGEHTVTVTGLNGISDTKEDSVEIYFAENGLKDSVESTASVTYAPVYLYNTSYESKDDGGYFVLEKAGFNPAVLASSYAQMAAYNAMNLTFGYTFEHSDYFMKLPSETRLALSEWAKEKRAKKQIKETDPTKAAYYNGSEMTKKAAWFKTFASNEDVSYKHGYGSRDKYYGALVGFDTDLRDHGDGWAHLFTGYVGTIGVRQNYNGGHIRQHGGVIGVTESFYKKNFYTAWTIAAGTAKAHEHTMYGHDTNRNDTYGIAAKFGWNIEFGDGKFSLLPTFTASYTTVNPEDYTSSADVKFDGSGVRAVQLNPNLKFIMNMENGFQPYLTVGEVWTVGQTSSLHANGFKLDELELKPYTEYGVGVQKRWADQADAYVQFMGHSSGRDGFLLGAGMRWNF